MRLVFLLLCFMGVANGYTQNSDLIYAVTGTVDFTSEAPLELIQAASSELKGLVDFENETFAFSIPVNSFQGFNSALQREHFNENYMETDKFPRATFSGKMIEKIDVNTDGEYVVRAKGELTIHGVEQERIIRSIVRVEGGNIFIETTFSILLQDHSIAIPKVVQYKIAEEINVSIKAKGEKK
jgi:hypothetical protein